ncbi:MAG: hypothetical protein AMXMBFR82_09920 [Candidatus Hydrogenedentota bacterium]
MSEATGKRVKGRIDRTLLFPILALVSVTVLLVPPAGDFPLNDDWVYGKMVQRLADEGMLTVHPYAQAYALVQTLWAWPFVEVFGFSFTVLRASTLVLAVLAVWGVALCARELGCNRNTALACAAVVFGNPLFLNLSYTFMSDVPFVCALVFSCLYFLRAMRTGSALHVLSGSTLAAIGFFNRQFGALIPIAFCVVAALWWLRYRRGVRIPTVAALTGPWLTAFALVLGLHLAGQRIYLPPHAAMRSLWDGIEPGRAAVLTISIALYMGLFLIPIAAGIFWYWVRSPRHRFMLQTASAFVVCGLLLAGLTLDRRPLPRFPNILRNLGVGPILLRDTYSVRDPWSPVTLPPEGLWVLTIFALLSAAICLAAIIGSIVRPWRTRATSRAKSLRRSQYLFLVLLGGLLLLAPYNPRTVVYFDRYLLPAIVPFVLVAATALPKIARPGWFRPTAFAVTLLFVFSLAGVQDYLAWNRARWEAIEFMRTGLGAKDTQIDGGYEFNGMYTSEILLKRSDASDIGNQGEKGWWVIHDRYRIAMTPQDRYEIVREFPYFSWLGFETREVLALSRAGRD